MANIKGRVVDYDTDSPILGVLVQGSLPDGTIFISGTTDVNGNYNLDHAGFDNLASKVTFSKDGYATQSMRSPSANGVDVPLPKAGTLSAVTVTVIQNKKKILLYIAIGIAVAFIYAKYLKKYF